jgi:hypothetical protein
MLGGSFVTTAWRVLRLRMEETPSSFGGQLRIYWISSRGKRKRGGHPSWGLCVGLTTAHPKRIMLLWEFSRSLGLGQIPYWGCREDHTVTIHHGWSPLNLCPFRGSQCLNKLTLRVLSWRLWRILSSGVWHRVVWLTLVDVSDEPTSCSPI